MYLGGALGRDNGVCSAAKTPISHWVVNWNSVRQQEPAKKNLCLPDNSSHPLCNPLFSMAIKLADRGQYIMVLLSFHWFIVPVAAVCAVITNATASRCCYVACRVLISLPLQNLVTTTLLVLLQRSGLVLTRQQLPLN